MQGEPGPEFQPEYAYVYNTGPQTVAAGTDIAFSSTGSISSGFTHTNGQEEIVALETGVYKVTYSVSSVAGHEVALFVNGAEVPGTTYGSGAGTQEGTGQAIISLNAGDQLTLRDHTSDAAFALQTSAGGSQPDNVNASITIETLR